MTVTDYPTFVAGQALTADELNLLAQHAFDRDRLVGRLIGFGVNGGLVGSLASNTLTITPGLAIDQIGEPLLMPNQWSHTFPTSGAPALASTAYPFVAPLANTYSIVLSADEDDGDLIECGEDDCSGHAAHHVRTVKVEIVAGRVTNPWYTFADDPLLDAEPLYVNSSGSVVGDLAPLKAAITAALGRLQPALTSPDLSNLNALAIPAGETTAIKAYKVGWINRVLFATIAALRCQMLAALPAIREANPAGVVLGAMERKSTGWEFHCDWRHAWEPPTGLSGALLGGSCANVCGPTRAYLKDALATFAPPPPPPPTPPTGGGGTGPVLDWCKGKKKNCFVEVIPDRIRKKIPELVWEEEIPIPDPGYIDPAPIDIYINFAYDPAEFVRDMTTKVFGTNPTNTLGDGYLNGTPLVGLEANFAKETAITHMQEFGGAGTVLTMPASQVMNQQGAQRAMAFSPSDTLLLGTNAQGAVVDIAVVPAIATLRGASEISNKATQAEVAAGQGLAIAQEAAGQVKGLDSKWQGTFNTLDGRMTTLQTEFSGFKGSTSGFAVLENRVGMLEEHSMKSDALGERIAKLEGKAIAQTGTLGTKTYTVDVGNTLAEFAQTAVSALKTIEEPRNKNLVKYIEAVERKQSELEIAVRAGDPEIVSNATLELLDNMRTMVGASGVDAGAKRQLDAQFREMKGMLG